jgi:putative transposase
MKVFGLQAPVYRFVRLASRLTAKTSDIAAVRRDALLRFERARRDGLSAEKAARAVGVSRASLHRWSKRLEPNSRRPHHPRGSRRTPAAGLPHVGPRQDRAARARRGLCRL